MRARPLRSHLAAALILSGSLAGAAGLRSAGIDPQALHERLAEPRPPLVIDVRSPDDYSSGQVPGAVNLSAPTVTRHLEQIRQAPAVVLYCNDHSSPPWPSSSC